MGKRNRSNLHSNCVERLSAGLSRGTRGQVLKEQTRNRAFDGHLKRHTSAFAAVRALVKPNSADDRGAPPPPPPVPEAGAVAVGLHPASKTTSEITSKITSKITSSTNTAPTACKRAGTFKPPVGDLFDFVNASTHPHALRARMAVCRARRCVQDVELTATRVLLNGPSQAARPWQHDDPEWYASWAAQRHPKFESGGQFAFVCT